MKEVAKRPVFIALSYFVTPVSWALIWYAPHYQSPTNMDIGPVLLRLLLVIVAGLTGFICLVISEQRKEGHPYFHYFGFVLNSFYVVVAVWKAFTM